MKAALILLVTLIFSYLISLFYVLYSTGVSYSSELLLHLQQVHYISVIAHLSF